MSEVKKDQFALPLFSIRRKFNQVSLAVLLTLLLTVWGIIVSFMAYRSVQDLLREGLGAADRSGGVSASPSNVEIVTTLQGISSGSLQLLAFGLLSLALLAFVVYMYVTVGLRTVALEVWIRRMGAGDLAYKVDVQGQDEVAMTALALEELRQRSIKAMQLDLVKKLSQDLQDKNEELERVLAELRQTQDQIILRQKLAELGELTAGVAHEIRNPLNFMKNFSEASDELLAELRETIDENADDLDDERRSLISEICEDLAENLQRIRSHGDRANRIVHDMLMLGRGGGSIQLVDINDLLREHAMLAFHSARALDPDFNLHIEEAFDSKAGRVPVIPEDMGRVFLNMVGNACYATDEKNRERKANGKDYLPTLWLQTEQKDDAVEVRIRDNGTGMPPDVLERVFNPFFTTKPADKGTGLGLSLSNDIVRQHGGSITPHSKSGEYTEMVITIPVS
ncbi:MAG: HAMP domain-containing histidine kinase [Chloroflexi bacterium]|nr:HAMP domain-containing histidine kinase [Chloroflexota bacterium]